MDYQRTSAWATWVNFILFVLIIGVLWWVGSTLVFEQEKNEKKIQDQFKEQQKRFDDLDLKIKEATKSSYLRRYFINKNSLLSDHSQRLYDISHQYSLDPNILAAIAMAESGGCRRYIQSTHNCFGWGGGHIRFDSIDQAIVGVGSALGKDVTYQRFQKEKTLRSLAQTYNPAHWQDYEQKLSYFVQEIDKYK